MSAFGEEVLPQSGDQSKVERYRWTFKDKPGKFQMVPKHALNIDHLYQRDLVSETKIQRIVREWCWASFGTLSVAQRPDFSLWVFDGQHRKDAGDRRDDIVQLPCMIFECENSSREADLYLQGNLMRTNVRNSEKFKAMVHRGDVQALEVKKLIEDGGYHIASGGNGKYSVCCIGAVLESYRRYPAITRMMWPVAVALHQGEKINEKVWRGLVHLECALERAAIPGNNSLMLAHNCNTLLSAGLHRLKMGIDRMAAAYTSGGKRVFAKGILEVLNDGRRGRRIPEEVLNWQSGEAETDE